MMSFATTEKNEATFNVVSDLELEMIREVADFEKYEKSKETADKVVWEKRYKIWSDFSFQQHVSSIENILERN
jgi:hypothetical protein